MDNDIRKIRRPSYELHVKEDHLNGTYVEITILSSNYYQAVIMKIILIIGLNYGFAQLPTYEWFPFVEYFKWISLVFLLLTLVMIRNPRVEQITVINNYGIQLSHWDGYVIFPYVINKRLTQAREFISREKIIDVIINEGFYQWYQVIFYLCIIIRNEKKLKIMFPHHIKMKLEDEKVIYQLCQRYLYTEEDKLKHNCI